MSNYRVNARKTDAFDIFNFKDYIGANPYLDTAAFVFDFAITGYLEPLPLDEYVTAISDRYPSFYKAEFESYAHLFARVAAETAKLDMDLHLGNFSIKVYPDYVRIALQSLHARTSREIVYFVWDWLETITQNRKFPFGEELQNLQGIFRNSVYGGPTVYSLLRAAYDKNIPTFYLENEGLMQYGYGKKQIRGVATTFTCDSQLDSDFTCRKDDCKAFLADFGFPVPRGEIVSSVSEALSIAADIGYPVAVKPVVGHKGIGVTANVQDGTELKFAFDRAVDAIASGASTSVIIEKSITGADFRLLCVDGKFVAATERRPASVVGDGKSAIAELIERENATDARKDTPTSALGKIQTDGAMEMYLSEQGLSINSILEAGRTVYLRKVANLSAGGLSIDATRIMHPDNIILTQDIAQHLGLTCLGIDVIARDISKSWKDGDFGIIEINAAPGIFMHLKPSIGESIDVPSRILETFFASGTDARIPILTFNRISISELQEVIDSILSRHPDWTVGAVCRGGLFLNRAEKPLNKDYNTNVLNLLRNPKLDILIAEYQESILTDYGMFYQGSNMVVLDESTEIEKILARDIFSDSTVITKDGSNISIRSGGMVEQYQLGSSEPFKRVYLKEITKIL